MKNLFKFLAVVAMAAPIATFAQGFSGVGTAVSTTNSYYVSPIGAGMGTPVVLHVDASFAGADTNAAASGVRFWSANTDPIKPTAASTAAATTITGSTNGLVAGDVLVVRYKANGAYQRVSVESLSGSTITTKEALTYALATTDEVYKMTLSGRIGNAIHHNAGGKVSASAGGGPLFVGRANRPTLTEAFGIATPILNNVSGIFLKP